MRKKLLMLAMSVIIAMCCLFSVGMFAPVSAELAHGQADENGWVQNSNMTQLVTNAEGASEFTFTADGVTTYNVNALDLTKANKLVLRSTAGNWTGVYLADDVSGVLAGGGLYDPGTKSANIKLSAIMQSNSMQVGYGFSTKVDEKGKPVMAGVTAGTPADVTKFMTIEFYIGTGEGEDLSYVTINGTKVVGEAGSENFTAVRSDFTDGKCYIVLQTLGANMTIAAMSPNEEPKEIPEATLFPTGIGSAQNAGFILTGGAPELPAAGYSITAGDAVNNITVNGEPISSINAMLYILPYALTEGAEPSPCIGLLPASQDTAFAWEIGDVITFNKGFTVTDQAGKVYSVTKADYSFVVSAVEKGTGMCAFSEQIGISSTSVPVEADRNYVNLNVGKNIPEFTAPVATTEVTQVTINGTALKDAGGYVNLATNNIIQIFKSEGTWTWNEGDKIILKKGLLIKVSDLVSYSLDANYILTASSGNFIIEKQAGDIVYQEIGFTGNFVSVGAADPYVNFNLTERIPGFVTAVSTHNVTDVLINGATLDSVGGYINIALDNTFQILKNEGGWTWKEGDTITLNKGLLIGIVDGVGYTLDSNYNLTYAGGKFDMVKKDYVTEEIGFADSVVSVGAADVYVNFNLNKTIPGFVTAVSTHGVTEVTINDVALETVGGYINIATPSILQILKNEGAWTWTKGDVIVLEKGLIIGIVGDVAYALDETYIATYTENAFSLTVKSEYQPVSVTQMAIGTLNNEGLYGMQIHFSEDVRGNLADGLEEGAVLDIAAEEWFNKYVSVNGKTIAEIREIVVQEGENPVYATVRVYFEGEKFVTLWIDSRAGVIESGGNKIGDGTTVTVMAGLKFPTGYETTEEKSFEWIDPSWQETVILDPLEFDVRDGQLFDVAIDGDGKAFINIPAETALANALVPSCYIQSSPYVSGYIIYNGTYFKDLPSTAVVQVKVANVLQVKSGATQWTVGDKVVFLKGMRFFDDEASKPSAKPIGELAHYYIFEYVGEGKVKVTVTDFYAADEDIELDYAGMESFIYSSSTDSYSFQLNFTKNIRGDVYGNYADITNESWIKDYILINGKTISELLAAKAEDGSPIANAVQVLFAGDDYIQFNISAKIPVSAGGVADADGNLIETVYVQIKDGFTVPRGGEMPLGITYKYEYSGWCEDLDLSGLEYGELSVVSVDNPVSVDSDGNIAFKIYFDKNISDTAYSHINAGADWLLGVDLGYTSATINYLASYGFIKDCLTKVYFNGVSINDLMNEEENPAFRPVNVVMVHYSGNEMQIVFRTNSVNTDDGTFGQRTPHAINTAEENPQWTITIAEGFSVPTLCKTTEEFTFTYNAETKRFERVIQEEVISEVVFETVYYNGVEITAGGTLNVQGLTALDQNLFTVVFKDGVNAPWEIVGNELKTGNNSVKLVASTTDGSGTTVEFAFTVVVTAAPDSTGSGVEVVPTFGCGSSVGMASVAGAVALLAAVYFIGKKRDKKDEN